MDVTYNRAIELRHTVDVFVAGGGPAGVAAAVTAARQGRSVFVAEAMNCFGGGGTVMLVPSFCAFTNGVDFLAGGIGQEICRLYYGTAEGGDSYWPLHAEPLKRLYDKLVGESGAGFTFHTAMIDVVCDTDGHVDYVVCAAKSGVFAVRAKVYLDCTGDGDLCARAGADFGFGDEDGLCMGSTLCQTWSGIDWARVMPNDGRGLEDAIRDGVFSVPDRHLPGMFPIGGDEGGGNIGHVFGVDGTDERSLTRGTLEGRAYVAEYERYYKKYLTGYENMMLAATAPYLGVRESRRVAGEYTMTLDDFIARADFPDEIGRYSYPVDIHVGKPGAAEYARFEEEFERLRYKPGESYGLPFRALVPKGLANVLVAGRCMSTDRAMQSSVRVMPCCYITGQAIGMAAAMAVEGGREARETPARELQARLAETGAFLPNRA